MSILTIIVAVLSSGIINGLVVIDFAISVTDDISANLDSGGSQPRLDGANPIVVLLIAFIALVTSSIVVFHLQEAKKSSRQARWISIAALIISVAALIMRIGIAMAQ